jgi:transmembrane sensor
MNPKLTKDTIINYLNGGATLLQKRQIEEWVNQENNEELFYKYLDEWEQNHLQFHSDIEAAIKRYQSLVNNHENPANEDELQGHQVLMNEVAYSGWKKFLFRYFSAAILILVATVAGDTIMYQQFKTRPGEISTWTLGDGSKVTLNANSSIRFKKYWLSESNRIVYLDGEAEFSVSHEKDHRRFIVKANNNLDIEVLGTVFTVFSRNNHTEVVLNEGIVELKHNQGSIQNKMTMQPGEKVVLNKNGQLAKGKMIANENFATWKDHRFVFNNTPLTDVIKILQDNYQIEAQIEFSEMESLTFSGSFRAETSMELISSVAEILDIRYEIRTNNTVLFTKPSEN